jgi:hypothetical protein
MGSERQRAIISRALGLSALVCRGHIESGFGDPKALEMHGLVLDWLLATGASDGLQTDESLLIVSPPGSLTRVDVARALFRAEQLAVIAWACGVVTPAVHDEHPHDRFIAQRLGFLRRDAVARLQRASMRDYDVIHSYARVAIAVEDRLKRFAIDGQHIDFVEEYGRLPVRLVAGDLAFDKLPLAAVDKERWQLALAAAVERASASRWLLAPALQRVETSAVYGDA